jgi:outer membrane protein assembly factor BamB
LALVSFPQNTLDEHAHSALVDLASGESWWTTRQNGLSETYGAFLVPHKDALLVYGKEIGAEDEALALLDFDTGEPLWTVSRPFDGWAPDVFGDGAQPPLFDSEDTMLLFLNGRAIRKYDLSNGKLIWETQDLERERDDSRPSGAEELFVAPTMYSGYAPMILAYDGRRFFAPHHNVVGAFSTYNGASRWVKPATLSGIPAQMERVPQGLLVRTIPEYPEESDQNWISLLDIRTGHEIWRSPRREGSIFKKIFGTSWVGSTPFLVHGDRIVVAAGGKLYTVELDTGTERGLCDLDFQGPDDPVTLEIHDDRYIVVGDQNALWCDFDGNVLDQVYYDPPENFGRDLAQLFGAALINAIGEVQLGLITIELQVDYSSGFEELFWGYTATLEGLDYVYMLTEAPGGSQIVRVSKDDGDEYGRITVDTHDPDYRICPYTSNLFWKSDERTISCFAF